MSLEPIQGDKAALRRRLLAARAAVPAPARADAAAAVARRLAALEPLRHARVILAYAALGSELDLDPFLRAALARGIVLALPWVDGPQLRIGVVGDMDADVAPGWRGVREPRPGSRRELAPSAVEAVIAPGVGFDRQGTRLGYGGGHYDRLLSTVPAGVPVVGVAFEVQVVDTLPRAAHDRPVGLVVTEAAARRPRR